jgi:2'-5' RNA ligase
VQTASASIQAILDRFHVFPAELSKVRHFPETNFLYLDIGDGNGPIRELHAALNSGELEHAERFEFRPHLTLGGPFEGAEVHTFKDKAETLWESRRIAARVSIDSLVCLWLPASSNCRDWRRVWSHQLGNANEPPREEIVASAFTSQTY